MEFNYRLFHIHSSLEQQVLGEINFLTRLEIFLFSAIITKINSLHGLNFFVSLLLSIAMEREKFFTQKKLFFSLFARILAPLSKPYKSSILISCQHFDKSTVK